MNMTQVLLGEKAVAAVVLEAGTTCVADHGVEGVGVHGGHNLNAE